MGSSKSFRPPVQLKLKLMLWFVAVAGSALILQFLVLSRELSALAVELPGAEGQIDHLARAFSNTVRASLLVVLPVMGLIGFLTGLRIARPVEILERFLKQVRDGGLPADCAARKGDELQELCALANEVTRPLRVPLKDSRPREHAAQLAAAPPVLGAARPEAATSDATRR